MKAKVDRLFNVTLLCSATLVVVSVFLMAVTLFSGSLVVIKEKGLLNLLGYIWDPVNGRFGILPFLCGTLLTSVMALIFSIPFSISIALFLGEYFTEGRVFLFFQNATDLLAGIPSIVYGFWGLFVLTPVIQKIEVKIGVMPYGVGIFTASVVLMLMIIPYAASISREVIALVPSDLKEAAYALGATQWEVIRHVILPYARSGVLAGILLSFGRAIGETMAVTMVIGNKNGFPESLFDPSNTMASVIANEFTEAVSDTYLSALVSIALVLFVVSSVFNMGGRYVIKRLTLRT